MRKKIKRNEKNEMQMKQIIPPIKAQMKMGETLGVLIVFFLLLGLSIAFYASFQKTAIRESIQEQFDKEAVRIALKAAYLPEIVCTQDRDVAEENCVDREKVQAFANLVTEQEAFLFYESDFRKSRITLQEVYPVPAAESVSEWVLYDNAPSTVKSKITTTIPVVIKNPLVQNPLQQRSIGKLVVEVYQ